MCVKKVTHPSTNRAQRRVTLLIEINVLPISQTTTMNVPPSSLHSIKLNVRLKVKYTIKYILK